MEENPWKEISSKSIYSNPWIEVEEHQVLNPVGKPGIYGVVRFVHYAIAIVPLDHNNNTWLVGQWRYPLNQYSWEVPEGGGKKNVSPLESAQRELLEETGLIAKRWTMIQKLHLSNSATDEEAYIFIAQDLTEGQAEPEETEALQLRKLPFEEVYQMVLRQEITDALSVAAILRTKITL
jgi:8-oxo-dGTP pyrophosphatase MutT (NUDIX family)